MAILTPAKRGHGPHEIRLVRFPLVLLAMVAVSLSPRSLRAQPAANEYQVKAAYLLNFARFVEWPPDVLSASSPMVIGVIGDDPFGGALEEILRGKSVNGHPIQLRHLRWNDPQGSCEIVFISTSEEPHLQEILRSLRHNAVLTVSDIDRFSLRGGLIELRMVGN
jgi:hypothetical protein